MANRQALRCGSRHGGTLPTAASPTTSAIPWSCSPTCSQKRRRRQALLAHAREAAEVLLGLLRPTPISRTTMLRLRHVPRIVDRCCVALPDAPALRVPVLEGGVLLVPRRRSAPPHRCLDGAGSCSPSAVSSSLSVASSAPPRNAAKDMTCREFLAAAAQTKQRLPHIVLPLPAPMLTDLQRTAIRTLSFAEFHDRAVRAGAAEVARAHS